MSRRAIWGLGAGVLVAWAWACSSDSVGFDASSGTSAGGAGGAGAGGDLFGTGGGTACASNADCNGGVCVDGVCCASADLGCGGACCKKGEVCLFDNCVKPGDACISPSDCPDGSYCEPALGGSGGGGQGGNCTEASVTGKCLPLPPLCSDPKADPDHCVDKCEYHPMAGQLDAVQKWQWGYAPAPKEFPTHADVWATPAVGRVFDANCDGKIDLGDPPDIVFVSGNSKNTCCQCTSDPVSACKTGVLRMLDGKTGQEIWSLDKAEPTSVGFAGLSVALGDVDGDKSVDVIAMTGEGKIAMINAAGKVVRVSDKPVDSVANGLFGWGGGIALGDMDGDGFPEIAYGHVLFGTTGGAITRLWVGGSASGGQGPGLELSYFVDLDGNGSLELLAGRSAYKKDGSLLWDTATLPDGFTAVADLDGDLKPEVVLVANGTVRVLEGADGKVEIAATALPGTGQGGPPTIADFDGDGKREIGVAMANFYSVMKPDYGTKTIKPLWSAKNHDNSSSVTGSSVFDFEGDGKAEVVYNDECWLWVFDGKTGAVRYYAPTQSFTATESSIVADVDGDGHAELLIIANGSDPGDTGWHCAHHNTGKDGYPIWAKAQNAPAYRGITVLGDSASSWVGTRMLWNQHAYSVVNACDPRDDACDKGSYYCQLPKQQKANWTLSWLNDFRQNVQQQGIFDAPDATVSLKAECVNPVAFEVSVRNIGQAGLPAGVNVGVFKKGTPEVQVAQGKTAKGLLPGQTEKISLTGMGASTGDTFVARILVDPKKPLFHECKDDNDESKPVTPDCVH